MPYEKEQAVTLGTVSSGEINQFAPLPLEEFDRCYADELYNPSEVLIGLIDSFLKTDSDKTGKLLEQIAFRVFYELKGFRCPTTFESEVGQIDLEVTGNDTFIPGFLLPSLHIVHDKSVFIVEAKDRKNRVTTEQFLRLCALLEIHYSNICQLGIFFTRKGASGFPKPERNVSGYKDSRAVQAIFHAKTNRYIIVFDINDIERLKEKGALIKIIKEKIEEIEKSTGKYLPNENHQSKQGRVKLPEHIAAVMD